MSLPSIVFGRSTCLDGVAATPAAAQRAEGSTREEDHESPAPLRVGAVVDSLLPPRWIAEAIRRAADLPYVDLCMVLVGTGKGSCNEVISGVDSNSAHTQRASLLFALYERLDSAGNGALMDPFEPTSIAEIVTERIALEPQEGGGSWRSGCWPEDLDEVLEHSLDVLLWMMPDPPAEDVRGLARHGTWWYSHGTDPKYSNGPAGFWEVADANPVTGSVLKCRGEDAREKVIYRSYSRANRTSVRATTAVSYFKAAHFVSRKLRELHALGPAALEHIPAEDETVVEQVHARAMPSNGQMVEFLSGQAARRVRTRLADLTHFLQWTLAFQLGDVESVYSGKHRGLPGLRHILPPTDRFWADPFPVRRNDRYHLFIEEYPYARRKGHISAMEIDLAGNWSHPIPVLERDYHLAYPFIFEWRGTHYMIPETERNRTIELYECRSFPGEWELAAVLMEDVCAVDTTLIEVGDRWWMFTSMAPEGTADYESELHIFDAPSPFGPWTSHPSNPVKSDIRSARPGGAIFSSGGALYRPAQDCAERYGHSLVVHEIRTLTRQQFTEVPITRIGPSWAPGLVATHTLNSAPGLLVLDGLRRRRKRG